MTRYSKCYLIRGLVGAVVGTGVGAIGALVFGAPYAVSPVEAAAVVGACGFFFAGETALIKLDEENVA